MKRTKLNFKFKKSVIKKEFDIFERLRTIDVIKIVFNFIDVGYFTIFKLVSKKWYREIDILKNLNVGLYIAFYNCIPKHNLCSTLSRYGHLNCLKWAKKNGYVLDESTCSIAALKGHLNCLKWAKENGCPWNERTCYMAALNGHLNCLKWARENGCPWNEVTCSNAARNGHLNCLKWARENGCPWDYWTCTNAKFGEHLDCLKYAKENGCDEWN